MNRDEEPHLERSSSVQNPLPLFGVCVALLLAATFRVLAVLLPGPLLRPLSCACVFESRFGGGRGKILRSHRSFQQRRSSKSFGARKCGGQPCAPRFQHSGSRRSFTV